MRRFEFLLCEMQVRVKIQRFCFKSCILRRVYDFYFLVIVIYLKKVYRKVQGKDVIVLIGIVDGMFMILIKFKLKNILNDVLDWCY